VILRDDGSLNTNTNPTEDILRTKIDLRIYQHNTRSYDRFLTIEPKKTCITSEPSNTWKNSTGGFTKLNPLATSNIFVNGIVCLLTSLLRRPWSPWHHFWINPRILF